MRRLFAVFLLIFCALSAAAQRHTGEVFHSEVKGSRTPITLRVQRQERNTWSCALVYPGDKVHFEMRAMNGPVVFDGTLPADSAAQLHALIPALEQIDPQAIQRKTRFEDVDIVLINVPTARGMNNLHFTDPSTRKPFKNAVDPLLKWLGSLNHEHLATVAATKSNGCIPEEAFDPGAANGPAPITAAVAERLSQRMLLRVHMFGSDEGLTHDRCILILPEGQYRYEEHTIDSTNRESTRVYAGALSGDETAELKKIVDEPGILNAQHTAQPPNGVAASDIESTELTIPCGDHVQRLDYYSVTGKRAAYANLNIATDIDERTMRPLNSFLRTSVEKRKGEAPIGSAAPNHCASY